MSSIRVISASAGTGKTHRLVEVLFEAITRTQDPVRPEAVIATTFTVKAAAELRERVRAKLLEAGLPGAAQRLGAARIGTVNSVCANLVGEFAFELGLPPEMRVLNEEGEAQAFEHALAQLVSHGGEDDGGAVGALGGPAAELLALEERCVGLDWLADVRFMATQARANRIGPRALRAAAAESADSLLAHLPPPAAGGAALERALAAQLAAFVAAGNPDGTKTTAGVISSAQRAHARLAAGRALSWWEWNKLATLKPAKASVARWAPVAQAAAAYVEHPQLAADIRAAVEAVHELAAQSLDAYAGHKRAWGVLDFTDQEVYALELLAREHVREILAGQVDLVLVDEFQDTSPLQLEVFLALARLAPENVWVGDQKQAIYGFRGTDPALMDAALEALGARGGASETLSRSWRSRAGLVRATNDVFAPVFETHGIPRDRVELAPSPATPDPDTMGAVAEEWRFDSSRVAADAAALAAATLAFLADASARVRDTITNAPRAPRPGDIAVLCRSNRNASRVAAALEAAGVPAVLGSPGLVATAEARVAIAALRLWVDGHDALAAAELGRFVACPGDPDRWLDAVLAADGAPFRDLDEVARVAQARRAAPGAGVIAAFDAALEAAGARELCLRWGRSALRLSNLEALRAFACAYVDLCEAEGVTCTLASLVAHFGRLAADELDAQATPAGQDAVSVGTWHGAKGLEWPVAVLYELGEEREPTAFGVRVVGAGEDFDFDAPLAGRWVRYWPDPFRPANGGNYKGSSALHERVRAGGAHAAEVRRAARESLRLLYVGWTRARDVLVFAGREGRIHGGVLATLRGADGVALLGEPGDDGLARCGGGRLAVRVRKVAPAPPAAAPPVPGEGHVACGAREHPPARLDASAVPGRGDAGAPVRIGDGIAAQPPFDAAALGTACHAFFAGDRAALEPRERLAMARAILKAARLDEAIAAEDLAAAGPALRAWIDTAWPDATWRREWPLRLRLEGGTEMHGYADLVLETDTGLVLVDHKCIAGELAEAARAAADYGGQLATYVRALESATGRGVIARWIHLPLQGAVVEIR